MASITLFQVATAEDWSATLYANMYGCDVYGYDGREALCSAPNPRPVWRPASLSRHVSRGASEERARALGEEPARLEQQLGDAQHALRRVGLHVAQLGLPGSGTASRGDASTG